MSKDELTISRGNPSHIEYEETKESKKQIWIYGNKQYGSYFEIEDEEVIKLRDRD
jgi:hypothetical protein